jgi:hypothetical protein
VLGKSRFRFRSGAEVGEAVLRDGGMAVWRPLEAPKSTFLSVWTCKEFNNGFFLFLLPTVLPDLPDPIGLRLLTAPCSDLYRPPLPAVDAS